MVSMGDESGVADDHAPYPLASARVQVRYEPRYVSRVGIRPNVQIPTGTLLYAAKLTPGRPSVKRGRVSKSPFLTLQTRACAFFHKH